MEIWKDVPGYEGLYAVSNTGKVKSIRRNIILRAAIDGNGYYVVVLSSKPKRKTFKVHQLVMIAFKNHKPCGMDLVVDHIDRDKTNNNLENLRIVSQYENLRNKSNLKIHKGIVDTNMRRGITYRESTGKWVARKTINKKQIHIGTFNCETSAYFAYIRH